MRGKRKNHFFLILVISYIILMVYRIVLTCFIGSKGVGYFSIPNELFFGIAFTLSYGFEDGAGALIESRINRAMYDSSKYYFRLSVFLAAVIGIILGGMTFCFAKGIAEAIFVQPLSSIPIRIIAPAIPLCMITGVLRGFFNSTDNSGMTNQSYLVFALTYSVLGVVLGNAFENYGVRVAALLKFEDYKYAYSAFGAALGLLIASLLTFLHALLIYFLYHRRTIRRDKRDYSRQTETIFHSGMSILFNSLFPFVIMAAFFTTSLINEIFVLKNSSFDEMIMFNFGEYYGKTFPILSAVMSLICFFTYPFIRKALSAAQREEFGNARGKLGKMIHRCIAFGIFATGMLLIFADNILDSIYASNGASSVKYMQLEALIVVVGLFALIFLETLLDLRYANLVAIICAIALVIHIVLNIVFVNVAGLSIIGIIIANLIFFVIIAIAGFIFVTRIFQYTQEWFRVFGVSIIGAGISSLMGLLINKALSAVAGKLLGMVITFAICFFAYIIILLLLRGYTEEELESSVLGRIIASIGRTIRLL